MQIYEFESNSQLLKNETQKILNEFLPMEKQIALMTQLEGYTSLLMDNKMKAVDVQYYLKQKVLTVLQQEADLAYTQAQTANVNEDTRGKQLQNDYFESTADDIADTLIAENLARRAAAGVNVMRSRIEKQVQQNILKDRKKHPDSYYQADTYGYVQDKTHWVDQLLDIIPF